MKTQHAAFGTALLIGALVAAAPASRAQVPTPVGPVWDCVVSGGSQRGLALITFSDTGFTGYQLLAPKPPTKDSYDPRNPVGTSERDTSVTNALSTPKTNLFGFSTVNGSWGLDERSRVIGNFTLNVEGIDASPVVYPVSFIGKATTGKRLSLVAYTPNGKLTYSGVPRRAMPALSGSWYSTRKVSGQTLIEFFSMVPYVGMEENTNSYAGIYLTSEGQGPGYTFNGVTMLSSQKKIGLAFLSSPTGTTNTTLYATYGSFSSSSKGTKKASTTGVQEPYNKVSLNAVWLAPLPPPNPPSDPPPAN